MTVSEIGRRRRRKPGNLADLRRVLWGALLEVEEVMGDANPDRVIRAAHGLGTLSGAYLKAIELSDLEARVEKIEQQLKDREDGWRSDNGWSGSRIA